MLTSFLRALRSGDATVALTFWRSKLWTDEDRAAARRLLIAARTVANEVLP